MKNNSGKLNISIWALVALIAVITFVVVGPKLKNFQQSSSIDSELNSIKLEKVDSEAVFEIIRNSHSQLKLVNLWATWCRPCIEEFPALLKLKENYADQGLEVIFISMDMVEEESRVRRFLMDQKVGFVSYLKNESDNEFINKMNTDWSGALPATFIYDQAGNQVTFWTGDKSYEEFENEIESLMKQ